MVSMLHLSILFTLIALQYCTIIRCVYQRHSYLPILFITFFYPADDAPGLESASFFIDRVFSHIRGNSFSLQLLSLFLAFTCCYYAVFLSNGGNIEQIATTINSLQQNDLLSLSLSTFCSCTYFIAHCSIHCLIFVSVSCLLNGYTTSRI